MVLYCLCEYVLGLLLMERLFLRQNRRGSSDESSSSPLSQDEEGSENLSSVSIPSRPASMRVGASQVGVLVLQIPASTSNGVAFCDAEKSSLHHWKCISLPHCHQLPSSEGVEEGRDIFAKARGGGCSILGTCSSGLRHQVV